MRILFIQLNLVLLSLLYVNALDANIKTIKTKTEKIKIERVLDIDGIPWSIEFFDDHLIISEKEGRFHIYDLKQKKIISTTEVPGVKDVGQGGLLDVKLHPNFKENKQIFYSYAKSTGGGYATTLAKAFIKENKVSRFSDILVTNSHGPASRHFGSRIAFNKTKDKLFLSIGDRGERDKAQDLMFHNGKVLRLNLDGSFPKDNPFPKSPAVWSYGHRNPQGLFFDDMTGILYEQEHGPRGGDEINIIKKGKNYGWPIITYGKEYWGPSIGEGTHKKGLEQPIYYYVPSIAPCGLLLYRGEKLKSWNGQLLSGALKLKHINLLTLVQQKNKTKPIKVTGEERIIENWKKRIRYIAQSPDQLIYFSTDSGEVYRISH